MNLSLLLWGIPQAMRAAARFYPEYAARLKERDLVAQIKLRDTPDVGRWIKLYKGRIITGKGIHAEPDVTIGFKSAALAKSFLTPPFDQLERIDAAKNYKLVLQGPDDLAVWFLRTLGQLDDVVVTEAFEVLATAQALAEAGQTGEGAILDGGVEVAFAIEAATEPDHFLDAVDDPQFAVLPPRDEQVEAVAAQVHGRVGVGVFRAAHDALRIPLLPKTRKRAGGAARFVGPARCPGAAGHQSNLKFRSSCRRS